jgi:hypothetical protein
MFDSSTQYNSGYVDSPPMAQQSDYAWLHRGQQQEQQQHQRQQQQQRQHEQRRPRNGQRASSDAYSGREHNPHMSSSSAHDDWHPHSTSRPQQQQQYQLQQQQELSPEKIDRLSDASNESEPRHMPRQPALDFQASHSNVVFRFKTNYKLC